MWMQCSSAAQCFVGKHDFSAFAASRGKGEQENPVKEIWKFDIQEKRKGTPIHCRGERFSIQDGKEYGRWVIRSGAGED